MLRHIRHIYGAFGWLRRRCIIPVITCYEQMQSRCALLLAQVLHSRGGQVCLAMPDNVVAICLRLLTSSVLQRKASKRSVKEATRGMVCVVGLQNRPTSQNLYFLKQVSRGASESRHMAAYN